MPEGQILLQCFRISQDSPFKISDIYGFLLISWHQINELKLFIFFFNIFLPTLYHLPNSRSLFPHSSRGWKSEIRIPALFLARRIPLRYRWCPLTVCTYDLIFVGAWGGQGGEGREKGLSDKGTNPIMASSNPNLHPVALPLNTIRASTCEYWEGYNIQSIISPFWASANGFMLQALYHIHSMILNLIIYEYNLTLNVV